MLELIAEIEKYVPANEQEAVDRAFILEKMRTDPSCFSRDNRAHMACSVWTVDPTFTHTLLVYHNIYNSWSWIGGHADGCTDLRSVALRELEEETGVVGELLDGIASLEVLTVDGHEKRGAYVGSHLHLNVTYLAVAPMDDSIRIKPDENSGVQWVPLRDILELSDEPWICERIYKKLIEATERARSASTQEGSA